jgi:hypothetical protein
MRKEHVLFSIASVFLLLGTSIGVYVYSTQRNTPQSNDAHTPTRAYKVTWETTSLEPIQITGFAGRDSEYTNTISFSEPNLNGLQCDLSWIDDKATVLNHCGLDTLTLQITCPDGTTFQDSAKSSPKTKLGTAEVIVPLKTERLAPMTLYSSDVSEVTSRVQDTFDTTWVNQPFHIKVTDQIGELRPLKRMQDQGNDFTLIIVPMYSTASITDVTPTTLDTNDTQGNPGIGNATSKPLAAGIKAGPLVGYAPLVVHFYANPDNDTSIVSYHWMFGPSTLPIIPQASYRDHRLLVLLLFMLLSTQSPLFSFVGISLFLSRLMRVESQYESTDRAPTMVLGATGNYWATLTVTDAQGRFASDTVWITVLQYVYPDDNHKTS